MIGRWPSPSKKVVDHAAEFLDAAEILFDRSLIAPSVMNATFAIELFLKSCLVEDKFKTYEFGMAVGDEPMHSFLLSEYQKTDLIKEYEVHKLRKLWEGISEARKSIILDLFLEDKVLSVELALSDFESALFSLEGIFMDSRYAYSKPDWFKGLNIQLPIHIARLLKSAMPKMDGVE